MNLPASALSLPCGTQTLRRDGVSYLSIPNPLYELLVAVCSSRDSAETAGGTPCQRLDQRASVVCFQLLVLVPPSASVTPTHFHTLHHLSGNLSHAVCLRRLISVDRCSRHISQQRTRVSLSSSFFTPYTHGCRQPSPPSTPYNCHHPQHHSHTIATAPSFCHSCSGEDLVHTRSSHDMNKTDQQG